VTNSAGFRIWDGEAFTGSEALSAGAAGWTSFFLSSSGFFFLKNDNY